MKEVRHMKMKSIRVLLALITGKALVLTALSLPVQANETTRFLKTAEDFSSATIKNRDVSLAIPVEVVRYKLRRKQNVALVDIRSRQDFKRLHIPGSMNIPLYAVKTKLFLKSSSVVLINEGFHYRPLISECRRLKSLGFKTFVLDGGLPAWKRKGGRLEGDLSVLNEMRAVAPRIYFQEKDYGNNLTIDISPVQSEISRKLIPWSKHLPLSANRGEWSGKLRRFIKNRENQPFRTVFVLDDAADGYDQFEEMAAGLGVNTFYLKGGIAGYKRYLENLALSRRPRNNRIKTDTICTTCRQENETLD